jgi:hypothetical protein
MYEHEETATKACDEQHGSKCAGPAAFFEHRLWTLVFSLTSAAPDGAPGELKR